MKNSSRAVISAIPLLIFLLISKLGVIVLLTVTSFVPDEYFQYGEPAYRFVFGPGILSWEWQADYRIRSYIPLLPCIAAYTAEYILVSQ